MKTVTVILFLAIGCLAVISASPVPQHQAPEVKNVAVSSRQAAPAAAAAAPAAPAASDDDDDDDDDDDIADIAGVGDYDDDDDDEEDDDADDDDDDDDYLERFIEDILGGEDDDDDEETPAVVEPVQPASPAQAQATALPAAVQADLNAEDANNVAASGVESVVADAAESTASYEDVDVQPEGQAVAPIEGADTVANPVVLTQQASAPSQTADNDDDDDDDDEDDDDLGLDITEDDDSEEDDDEEDDDEADDDDDEETDEIEDIVDIADARRSARAMNGEPMTGDVSSIYVAKYNKFVDSILSRINRILKENYDPVTVKLTSSSGKTNKTKKKKNTKTRITSRDSTSDESTTTTNLENQSTETSPVTASSDELSRASGKGTTTKPKRTTVNKNKKKTPTKATTVNKNKTKQTKPKSKSKAKATLYGLSSLKRSGDVSVNMMSDHTTIKTKFSMGPLTLKVEKVYGAAAKAELRHATATTAEMNGRLSLRVLHGGAATLHSIRVLQPKQVRVDSPDNHDKTREFVWKRSAQIARLVSQKLSSATKSMLRPAPAAA